MISKFNYKNIFFNKSVKYEYFVLSELEAGIVLKGWEVKSLRSKQISVNNSYITLIKGEFFLVGLFIHPLFNSSYVFNDSNRFRKLLVNKNEIKYLINFINCNNYTLIIISLYWKKSFVKVKIGVVKGKNKTDRRMSIKNREWQISKSRIIKRLI